MLAVKSAIEICEALAQLNVDIEKLIGKKMAIRIGISSGPVFSGNVGCFSRMNYTVIGDTVNVAARLESVNRDLGTTICVTDAVRDNCKEAVAMRCLGSIPLKGFKVLTRVHEVLGYSDRLSIQSQETLSGYTEVDRELMHGGEEPEALARYIAENPKDVPPSAAAALRASKIN
eukprot:m51a1_g9107 putative adenylate cyclase (174) ;mRNA; r:97984-98570